MDRLATLDRLGHRTGRVNARVLVDKLSDSMDLRDEDFGPESFAKLLTRKFDECTLGFIESIKTQGVISPVGIVDEDGRWCFGEGHHRLAVAFYYDQEIPYVLFKNEDELYDLFEIFGLDYDSAHDTERVIL